MTNQPTTREKINFILLLGRSLHAHGYPAHRLEEVLERPFATSVPDQQVVIKDQKVPIRANLKKLFGALDEKFNILMDRGIVMVYGIRSSVSREEFPVWE
ncbi:MAG: hypothetical protein EBZ36_03875 [Acidobacteria bacterium]|nr:hypothetical protein [Acidobacteriota bacterium]